MSQINFEYIAQICTPQDYEHHVENPPDFPPESFWLSKDAEFDWFDQNAFLDRKNSEKWNSIYDESTSNPFSHRFSTNLVSKASIISLPTKPKSVTKMQLKKNKMRLPTPNELALRSSVEPTSPMVSCIGRVSSCGRRSKTKHKATPDARHSGKIRRIESRWVGLYMLFMKKFFPHQMIKSKTSSAQPSRGYTEMT